MTTRRRSGRGTVGRLVVVAVSLSAAAAHAPPPDRVTARVEIHEVVIDLGGDTIRALCTDGARRVVLWHDGEGDAGDWRPVLERLDGTTGACAFDRRGSGASRPAPDDRGWYELLDELRRIHLALGFEQEYVLVAHGTAGLYARLYVADRPGDVGALVLVEPAHEELLEALRLGMPRSAWEAWREAVGRPNADGVVERRLWDRASRAPRPAIPVTVVTAGRRQDGGGWNARFLDEGTRRVHASIVRGVIGGRHVPASRSGPDVPREQPGLIAAEVGRALRGVASSGRGRPE